MRLSGRNSLAIEIGFALAFKVAALALLYLLFFGPPERISVTPQSMAAFVSDTGPPSQRK